MDDNFADYRTFCANRIRRLERYKKAKSLCSVKEEDNGGYGLPSGSNFTFTAGPQQQQQPQPTMSPLMRKQRSASLHASHLNMDVMREIQAENVGVLYARPDVSAEANRERSSANVEQTNFDVLREKMISLMENDVRLLQQLLALGDSIQELKTKNQMVSQTSLNSLDEEKDEDTWTIREQLIDDDAVTNLYVDDEPKENTRIQYFSRKNSVLRIPIPPRSSNRMSVTKRIPRRVSELTRPPRRLHIDEDSHSDASSSEPGSALQSPANNYGTPSARMSTASIDSGIRDAGSSIPSSGSPSPTFKDQF